jgi:uncharacterized membrane protein
VTLEFLLVLLLLNTFAYFLPGWARPELFFGVTVNPEFRRTGFGRNIQRRYRLILWGFAILAICLQLASGFAAALLIQVVGYFCAVADAHRQTLAHSVPRGMVVEVNLSAPRETMPGGLAVALLPVGSLSALALWASHHWDRLPQQLPVHWGLHGPDRWVNRTSAAVYGFLAVHAAISLGFVLVAFGILHWSRRISTGGALAEGDRTFRRRNVEMILLISYFPAVQAWIVLLQPSATGLWWGASLLAIIAIYFALLIRSGRGGNRTVTPSSGRGSSEGDRTSDAHWKWGIFYFDPADPSIFVEKRFGIGYTVNFGNRWSWAVLGLLLVAILARGLLR